MRGVGDHRVPSCRQFICRDQACEGELIWRSRDRVTSLAADLDGHDDARQTLGDEGGHEQVGALRLTCCEGPRYKFRNDRPWQGFAEAHPGIDELLHVAIDEYDVAALTQAERGLSLALELGEVALAQRRRGGQRLQSLHLAADLTVNVRRQSMRFNRQDLANGAKL